MMLNSIGFNAMPTWNKPSRKAPLNRSRCQQRSLTDLALRWLVLQTWQARVGCATRASATQAAAATRLGLRVRGAPHLLAHGRLGLAMVCPLHHPSTARPLPSRPHHRYIITSSSSSSSFFLLRRRCRCSRPRWCAQLCWTRAGWSTGWTDRRYSPPTETTR